MVTVILLVTVLMRILHFFFCVFFLTFLVSCESAEQGTKVEAMDDSPLADVLATLDGEEGEEEKGEAVGKRVHSTFENWYPADITPPKGTQYPCALTALPKNLSGVPAVDKEFINHVYALILRAVQAKLVVMKHIGSDKEIAVYKRYAKKTVQIRKSMAALRAPNKRMKRFRAQVLEALELQMIFFKKVIKRRDIPRVSDRYNAIPEGREASNKLKGAWKQTLAEYPDLSAAMKDSLFHHLCALDVF